VSADDRTSHEAFREKFSLNFPLLCDGGHKVCDAYGVWGPTKWGEGIRRTTVIVGADGAIKKVFENVTPQGHAAEVLAAL
jgi:peroxiredoxin Q/BCP